VAVTGPIRFVGNVSLEIKDSTYAVKATAVFVSRQQYLNFATFSNDLFPVVGMQFCLAFCCGDMNICLVFPSHNTVSYEQRAHGFWSNYEMRQQPHSMRTYPNLFNTTGQLTLKLHNLWSSGLWVYELTRPELVQKFPAFWARKFIAVFTTTRHLSLSLAS
jgi:hypothetical protein